MALRAAASTFGRQTRGFSSSSEQVGANKLPPVSEEINATKTKYEICKEKITVVGEKIEKGIVNYIVFSFAALPLMGLCLLFG